MLTYMRSRSQKWVKIVVFGIIILVFVLWGGSSYLGNEANKVAKIDKHIITTTQYSKAYQDALKLYQSKLGDNLTPDMIKQLDLKVKVLDQIIDDYVLNVQAKKLGISISDEELQKAITEFQPFQQDGQFSSANYRRILQYQRLTPAEFEEMQRKELLRQRVYAIVTENVIVTPEEAASFYKYQNDTFDLNYLTLDVQAFMKDITVSDSEVGIYYDKNKEKYKIPSKVILTYIDFPAARYLKDVTVSIDDARTYYDSHKDQFTTKTQVHGRHILLRVSQGESGDVVRQKQEDAQKIYQEIKAGGDFAALAGKYSEDPGTNFIGGDIGLVPKDSLPEPMGEALYNMKPGEVVPPVRTSLGFHILKLEDKEEGKLSSFEEVSLVIIENMKTQRAKILAGDDANNAFKELYEQGNSNLVAYAGVKGLQIKELGPFAQNDNIGIPNSVELAKNAFGYPEGEIGSVVDTKDGYMIYMVKDKISARVPELSEVKDRLANDLKMSKATEKAKAYAAGVSKDPVVLGGMPHLTTGEFKRTAYMIPKIGMVQGIKDDLDKLKSPKVYTDAGKIYIVWIGRLQVADVNAASVSGLDKVRKELLSRKKETAVEDFLTEARKQHKIVKETEKLL